ncbi:MAG: glycosyl transferase [Ignavibacteria bacterium RIFOXYB2_FULL_35_12]|nr:MAG: glycosyl transferase [Ignavibacteria bacterium GWA2_36_19]OGU51511.1 MAG: glycosyl transferase [Ignavibacteria bacterium GWC2_35_8]OGU62486.1 MAG: glycosyl transferase [Ignavibacteria bacterium GWF2_35_20]OGU78030.1 MAG: glycosyl transferase [Ignavibacteria bacterium RBG_16_35_7]OGU81720.1 MAG: glycosyl transferase [Ignavibacteria bacterium RIFOXYA2_FULL_35_9]OGU86667.1 MAG: glycosyl transferase [Ignavibacteria bacterium RIFOXYA12_FULL_35_25]OGU87974.1 MAG: glycosyl transferase [Ignav
MYNFCTLFNTKYLSRGLALYHSLKNVCNDFHLYIFAFDDQTYAILNKLQLPDTTIISLSQFEDKDLLSVKSGRTITEYCWTATPATIYYVIKNFDVESCTYIDADIYFYLSPKIIFDELGDNSILITEHRFSREYRKEEKLNGRYCVQFITFKNDEYGLGALIWWKNQCINWCYNRIENGKFGDQKYLDDWTTRFKKVHVLQHLGCGLAGWNISQYKFYKVNDDFYGLEKKSGLRFDVVFYHFHYIRYYTNGKLQLGARIISESAKEYFYRPYLKELDEIKQKIVKINPQIDPHGTEEQVYNWKTPLSYLKRKIIGTHNVYKLEDFSKQ